MSEIGLKTVMKMPRSRKEVTADTKDVLQGLTFVIKDYQRGYRWGEEQIEALLEDIDNFKTPDSSGREIKYCLQPLVVKPLCGVKYANSFCENRGKEILRNPQESGVNHWELIDGQQRLTTILMILNYCYTETRSGAPLPYDIIYVNQRKIDEAYMKKATEIIGKWFDGWDENKDTKITQIRDKLRYDAQFIWYEVSATANSSEVFTKLNMGKVPLTNAELFKALLLRSDLTQEKKEENERLSAISYQWDSVEQSMYEDDFWNFLSNDKAKDKDTRIDFLLRLFALQNVETENTNDDLFPFLVVNRLIDNEDKTETEIWGNIVSIYETLKEWYSSHELYHKIGFLIAINKNPVKFIQELICEVAGKKKSQVAELIDTKIHKEFVGVDPELLDFDNKSDKKNIKRILLYFNVYTMLKSKTESRFSFRLYKEENWDIEHVHARASDEQMKYAGETEQREFLEGLKGQLAEIGESESVKEIDEFLGRQSFFGEDFLEFYKGICDKYGKFYENGIGNLVLLDAGTNREYKNAPFVVKRNRIIERDRGAVFVPVCTKNVFLKMYSDRNGLKDMLKWDCGDAQNYCEEIKKALAEVQECKSDKK